MEICLQKDEMLDFGSALSGGRLICLAGSCWLTQAGDSRDHILHPGYDFSVEHKGQLIVTATEDCRLMLISKPETSRTLWRPLTCNP